MPNTKKDHTGKCGNTIAPVKVVPTFLQCQKHAVKIMQHKRMTKCVTVPLQKRNNLFASTNAHNYVE